MPFETPSATDETIERDTFTGTDGSAADVDTDAEDEPDDAAALDDSELVAAVEHDDTEVERVDGEPVSPPRRWARVLTFVVLPVLALLLAVLAGFFKWQDGSVRASELARMQSVQAAKDTTVAILSYQPDSAEKDLGAAVQLLTGSFRTDYQDLINKVVIPGAQQQRISTTVSVAAASSVTASANHAVALLYVNQTTVVGVSRPTDLQSVVRVTMDKIDDRWLVSDFNPE